MSRKINLFAAKSDPLSQEHPALLRETLRKSGEFSVRTDNPMARNARRVWIAVQRLSDRARMAGNFAGVSPYVATRPAGMVLVAAQTRCANDIPTEIFPARILDSN